MLTYYYLPLYTKKILQYPKKTSLAIETCTDFCIISKRVSKKISNLLLSKKGLQVFLCSSSLPYLLLAASVVDPKLFFFLSGSHFPLSFGSVSGSGSYLACKKFRIQFRIRP
jgi:hypothetical protein